MTLEQERALYNNMGFLHEHIKNKNKMLEDTIAFMGLLRYNIELRR